MEFSQLGGLTEFIQEVARMEATQAILIVLLIAAAAFAVWYVWRRRRREHFRSRFGPEYERAVREQGSETRAEAELRKREERRERLHIEPLGPSDREHYLEVWKANQARFVDDPDGAVLEADGIITEIMKKRGYPVANFERRIEDISVDHPRVVEHYRAASAIQEHHRSGRAGTEELRKAMVYYRALFDELVELTGAHR
jgi:hypothetical protein